MKLTWHNYRYFPYERQLAFREVASLLGSEEIRELANGIELVSRSARDQANRLVYFSQFHDGQQSAHTVQDRLERAANAGRQRQATRYSVHGLHEYKGKFNPQIVKAILNIFGVHSRDRVLDPFCGSGTTLVECAQIGACGYGFDINPLAVYIANAKLQALITSTSRLDKVLNRLETSFDRTRRWSVSTPRDARSAYLRGWFEPEIFGIIETVRHQIEATADSLTPVFLTIASNLLRNYSLQDPNDLRIRRRKSPLPSTPFRSAFLSASRSFINRLAEAQSVLGLDLPRGIVKLCDVTSITNEKIVDHFDAALTSPPYAMALPYIDTQRLSLVWLGLVPSDQILRLEAELIGSREMRGNARRELLVKLKNNTDQLPSKQFKFCLELQSHLGSKDGFRRQAVPSLLYRYFASMLLSFRTVLTLMRASAPYALIVGHNHTNLGDIRYDIDTPKHLAALAAHAGWRVEELIELQTYRRYGYHIDNAVVAESLIILRKP
jgi:site-specific DNA-methyltransferase (cytosine-N4-specific)